jgi:purine-nucleoside phosphorylase
MAINTGSLIVAAEKISKAFPGYKPGLAVVMGSGWREVANGFTIRHRLEFSDIPELGAPQVAGHGGQLLLAELAGHEVLIFAGRRHWYEGVGWDPIAFPACLAKVMGAAGIVLTNSAGGIRKTFQAGTVMVIEDHINFMGTNPLIGMSHPFWGARFPDMTCIYDQGYRRKLDEVAQAAGFPLAKGVYLAVTGPSYETPAEISAFRQMGADAVGMSTVPEAILAHAAGLKVAGLSCITNAAAGGVSILSHEEVLVGARAAIPALTRVLQEFVKKVAAQ